MLKVRADKSNLWTLSQGAAEGLRGRDRSGLHGGHSAQERTTESDFPERRRQLSGHSMVQHSSLECHRFVHE